MTAVPSRVRRFNGEDDCTLNLQRRGVTMDADFLTANGNPLVAICNYVFDTLTSVSSPHSSRAHHRRSPLSHACFPPVRMRSVLWTENCAKLW